MNDFLVRKLVKLVAFFQSQNQLAFLFRNDQTPAPGQTSADYSPCNYNGATGIRVNWTGTPYLLAQGVAAVQGDTLIYQPTGVAVTNNAYGYYVVDTVTATLIYAERFEFGPFAIGGTLAPIVIVPTWREQSIPA
jgi:hypothetical protein